MEKFVGVFNPEWQLVAVVKQDGNSLVVVDVVAHDYSQIIAGVLDRLKTEDPKLNIPVKDEDGCVIDMLRVGPEDERYLDGVTNELRRPGLQAYALSSALLDTLKKVNQAPVALRVQVVPEVLDLDTEHALVALEAIS